MALKGLGSFQFFSLENFLEGKRVVYLKAVPWNEGEGKDARLEGAKVVLQILEDKTKYQKEGIDNYGEQITVKVRGVPPATYHKLKPLSTEVIITDVEKASVYGEYRNELSIIAVIDVKGGGGS